MAMKSTPILFSKPMVLAILEGRKTQTRRVINPQPAGSNMGKYRMGDVLMAPNAKPIKSPYGLIGDQLWVRETWSCITYDDDVSILYAADDEGYSIQLSEFDEVELAQVMRWGRKSKGMNPSIHMPRWASRIDLEITDIRVERLNDCSEEDALAEGCESTAVVNASGDDYTGWYATDNFAILWDSINGAGSWFKNPWVWVVEFKVINT